MIHKQSQPVRNTADTPSCLHRLTRLGVDLNRTNQVHGSVGAGIGGIGPKNAAAIFEHHCAQVLLLAGFEIIRDQVSGGCSGAAAVVELLGSRSIIKLAIMRQRKTQRSVRYVAPVLEAGDAELTQAPHFAIVSGMRIEGEQDGRTFLDTIELLRLTIPDDSPPSCFRLLVIPPQRDALLTNRNPHVQLLNFVGSRIVFEDLPLAKTAVHVALVVDTQRAADRLPIIDAAEIDRFARGHIVIDKVRTRMSETVDPVE